MFNPDDLAADTLEAMADTVLTDAEWAEAFGWDAEEDTTTEAAYWQQVDAANDYADYLEARAMADLDEDDDDQGYDPTPDGEPAPPRGRPPLAHAAGGMRSSRISGNQQWRNWSMDPGGPWSNWIGGSRSSLMCQPAPRCANARIVRPAGGPRSITITAAVRRATESASCRLRPSSR
jgi:hypothetical protein